ncbi:hypothetical protein NL676_011283 [Syzygium grande]|nr:hypothetical protein NL676_011283 [Syzygium grande]
MDRVAVVTGANKGISFEICKQLASNGVFVVLMARDVNRGNEAIEKLASIGISNVVFHPLDVVDGTSFIPGENIKEQLNDVDSLTEEKVDGLVVRFLQDMKEDRLETGGWPIIYSAYIVSKATLNAYTRVLAKKYPGIAINAVTPGFVKTDLNHNSRILPVEEGARGPVMVALMPKEGPSGLFFDRTVVSTF